MRIARNLMSRRKLRVGVIGAGHLGTIHTRLLRSIDDVELVGVSDPSRRRAGGSPRKFRPKFADHRELLGRSMPRSWPPRRDTTTGSAGTGGSRHSPVRGKADDAQRGRSGRADPRRPGPQAGAAGGPRRTVQSRLHRRRQMHAALHRSRPRQRLHRTFDRRGRGAGSDDPRHRPGPVAGLQRSGRRGSDRHRGAGPARRHGPRPFAVRQRLHRQVECLADRYRPQRKCRSSPIRSTPGSISAAASR